MQKATFARGDHKKIIHRTFYHECADMGRKVISMSEERAKYNPIPLEEREEIQKAMHVLDNAIPHTSSIRKAYRVLELLGPEWIRALLSSEQAWREEAERLQSVCKQLIGEEVMFQEGKYETEMSKLQASEQAWREEALRQHPTPDAYEAVCKALDKHCKRADKAQEQLNQAVEVLKWYADENGYVDYVALQHITPTIMFDKGKQARNFLSSLSKEAGT